MRWEPLTWESDFDWSWLGFSRNKNDWTEVLESHLRLAHTSTSTHMLGFISQFPFFEFFNFSTSRYENIFDHVHVCHCRVRCRWKFLQSMSTTNPNPHTRTHAYL